MILNKGCFCDLDIIEIWRHVFHEEYILQESLQRAENDNTKNTILTKLYNDNNKYLMTKKKGKFP